MSDLIERLLALVPRGRTACGIAGESGAGKTTLAAWLAAALDQRGVVSAVLHQDQFFRLPPRQNHQRRLANRSWIGPGEVDLERLGKTVAAFVDGAGELRVPWLLRAQDRLVERTLHVADATVLIVEGTYAMRIAGLSLRIFLAGDHRQTEQRRRARGRDPVDDDSARILEIEHGFIAPDAARADLVWREDQVRQLLTGTLS